MRKNNLFFYIDRLFLTITGVLVVMGSVGVFKDYCIPLSITSTLIFLGIKLVKGVQLKIPKHFKLYGLFVLILLFHSLFFKGKIIYFWMFASGGLYYLSIYNLRDLTKKYISAYLYFLGILMIILFSYFKLKGVTYLSPDNLFLPIRDGLLHNHIGDLWALVTVSLIYKIMTKPKAWQILLIIVGLATITFSLSRSAAVALIIGVFYLNYTKSSGKNKMFPIVIILTCLAIFIYFSIYKSTFFARPYFMETIRSLQNTPWGFGMGNFSKVSSGTNVVHNLVLEVVGGMGVFSIVFIAWLVKIGKKILTNRNAVEFSAIFIALFVNFLFDSTYVIPGMFWIWFIVLALT